jgi:hypothetical protein
MNHAAEHPSAELEGAVVDALADALLRVRSPSGHQDFAYIVRAVRGPCRIAGNLRLPATDGKPPNCPPNRLPLRFAVQQRCTNCPRRGTSWQKRLTVSTSRLFL